VRSGLFCISFSALTLLVTVDDRKDIEPIKTCSHYVQRFFWEMKID